MPAGVEEFERTLRALVEQDMRSGRDPLLDQLRRGPVAPPVLRAWAAQYYLVIREFARFLSAIHSRCPDFDARALIAENIYEEQLLADGRSRRISPTEAARFALRSASTRCSPPPDDDGPPGGGAADRPLTCGD